MHGYLQIELHDISCWPIPLFWEEIFETQLSVLKERYKQND